MVRGRSRRRDANCTPGLAEEQRIRTHDEGTGMQKPAVIDSTDRQDKGSLLHVSAALHRLHGRDRGPWGGGKCWLDMTSKPRLSNNLSVKNRLLLARLSWGNTRLLKASPSDDFFPTSFRYRGHEGCVNAIKFHPREPWLFSGGDDLRLLIWEPRIWPRTPRTAIRTEHTDNIFCIDFDRKHRVLIPCLKIKCLCEEVGNRAKFVDTAGQVAAAALELGFIALADFRERPEVTHPVFREDGDMTSVDPHLPHPYQLAYAGSRGAGILDLRTSKPVARLKAPGILVGDSHLDFEEKCRTLRRSSTRRRNRSSSSSSSESGGDNHQGRSSSSIQENLELILRLQARVGSLLDRARSDSSSPDAPRVLRRITREPAATTAPRHGSSSGISISSSSSSSSSDPSSSSDSSSSIHSKSSLSGSGLGSGNECSPVTHSGRGKRRCVRTGSKQQLEGGGCSEHSSSSSSSSTNRGCDLTGVAEECSGSHQRGRIPKMRVQTHTVVASTEAATPSHTEHQPAPRRRRGRSKQQQQSHQLVQREQEQQRRPQRAATSTAESQRPGRRPRRQSCASPAASTTAEAVRADSERLLHQSCGESVNAGEARRRQRTRRMRRGSAVSRASSASAQGCSERPASRRGGCSQERSANADRQPRRRSRRSRRVRRHRQQASGEGAELRLTLVAPGASGDGMEAAGSAAQTARGGRPARQRDSLAMNETPVDSRSRGDPQESEALRAALRQAEAIAAQLPPIRFPTYAAVNRRAGVKQHLLAKTMDELPLVEMIDKVVYSWDGKLLLVIRRGKVPLIYSSDWELPLFELRSEGYINFKTMKGGCFLTDGRHVACGSENLKVHLWRLPSPLPHHPSATQPLHRIALLHGHLCVINCCASPAPDSPLGLWGPPMLATSGVEKMVRVWSWETLKDKDDCDDYPFDGRQVAFVMFITPDSTEDFLTIARFNRVTPHSEMSHDDEASDLRELLDEMYEYENFREGDDDDGGSSI
ncbi:hypothetical protein Emag_003692 [Eimeria magna]